MNKGIKSHSKRSKMLQMEIRELRFLAGNDSIRNTKRFWKKAAARANRKAAKKEIKNDY